MKTPFKLPCFALAGLVSGLAAGSEAAFDHTHGDLTDVLQGSVENDLVDYAALQEDPSALKSYLDTLAAVEKDEFRSWNENQRLAYLINLYNAATLKLVADHYPVKSIKKIGGLLSGPWKQEVVRHLGETITLDHLEHEIIRANYDEPRVHFALVCAAMGCPPLGEEAYAAGRLDARLEEQGNAFMADEEKNRVDREEGVLYLSPIFKWFKGDFTAGGGTVAEFAAPYFPTAEGRKAAKSGELSVEYTDYDWSLNDQGTAKED